MPSARDVVERGCAVDEEDDGGRANHSPWIRRASAARLRRRPNHEEASCVRIEADQDVIRFTRGGTELENQFKGVLGDLLGQRLLVVADHERCARERNRARHRRGRRQEKQHEHQDDTERHAQRLPGLMTSAGTWAVLGATGGDRRAVLVRA